MKKYWYVVILAVSLLLAGCVIDLNEPPNAPSNPSPADGATNVSVDVTLSWQASDPNDDTLKFDLYLGTSETNLELEAHDLTAKSYKPGGLEYSTTYHWKVVAKDPDGETATSPVWSFTTSVEPITDTITCLVVAYNAGPAVEGANVVVKSGSDELAQGVTDEDGEVTFEVAGFPEKVDVEIRKEGHALSKIEGLKVTDFVNQIIEVQLREAILDRDPNTQTFPEIELNFYYLNGSPMDITQPATEDFLLRVDVVESQNSPQIIYAKIGGDPGSGFFGPREFASNTRTVYFFMDISNYNGEVPLYVEFFDYNDNMVQKIEYLTINREVKEVEEELFVPFSWVDFGYANLVAYTRNQGVEFYSRDNLVETMSEKFDSSNNKLPQDFNPMKSFGKSLEAAPEGTNLWIEISWVDYDTLYWYGFIGPNVVRPDGYNVYRSFDGVHYTKIGVAESGYFRDPSAQNAPNKEVWYAVSSIRGNEESELVELGSIIPLDSFNVELISPADREKDVSRQPTFVWKPTKELTSPESKVEYYYTMWIYDLVQSENYILPGIIEDSTLFMYDFMTLGAEEVCVTFLGSEGSAEYDDLDWFLYLPDGIYYYDDDKLEPAKAYDWGVDYAYAVSSDLDSIAYSIAIDYGWGIDPLGGVMPEMHNEFTTGN